MAFPHEAVPLRLYIVTLISFVALTSPIAAVIVTVPADTPVTVPSCETVATFSSLTLQTGVPSAFVSRVYCDVLPTLTVAAPEIVA